MEKESADSGEEKRHLDGEAFAVKISVYQDRDQDGGAEHGEHVLEPEKKHFRDAEGPGVFNGSIWIHEEPPFQSIRNNPITMILMPLSF